jgi:very-short-patch-repair endonuclease
VAAPLVPVDVDETRGWQHVSESFLPIIDKLEAIFTRVRRIEDHVNINVHRVIDECIEEFGLSLSYDRKLSILAKIFPFLEDGFQQCESPIEKIMLFGLMTAFATYFTGEWSEIDGHFTVGNEEGLGCVVLGQQVTLGQYRVDFLLGASDVRRTRHIAIECDGHDFHERTAAQAERDRSRDRWMQAHGYIVLRFTGREIYRNPAGCAGEIFEALMSLRRNEE